MRCRSAIGKAKFLLGFVVVLVLPAQGGKDEFRTSAALADEFALEYCRCPCGAVPSIHLKPAGAIRTTSPGHLDEPVVVRASIARRSASER